MPPKRMAPEGRMRSEGNLMRGKSRPEGGAVLCVFCQSVVVRDEQQVVSDVATADCGHLWCAGCLMGEVLEALPNRHTHGALKCPAQGCLEPVGGYTMSSANKTWAGGLMRAQETSARVEVPYTQLGAPWENKYERLTPDERESRCILTVHFQQPRAPDDAAPRTTTIIGATLRRGEELSVRSQKTLETLMLLISPHIVGVAGGEPECLECDSLADLAKQAYNDKSFRTRIFRALVTGTRELPGEDVCAASGMACKQLLVPFAISEMVAKLGNWKKIDSLQSFMTRALFSMDPEARHHTLKSLCLVASRGATSGRLQRELEDEFAKCDRTDVEPTSWIQFHIDNFGMKKIGSNAQYYQTTVVVMQEEKQDALRALGVLQRGDQHKFKSITDAFPRGEKDMECTSELYNKLQERRKMALDSFIAVHRARITREKYDQIVGDGGEAENEDGVFAEEEKEAAEMGTVPFHLEGGRATGPVAEEGEGMWSRNSCRLLRLVHMDLSKKDTVRALQNYALEIRESARDKEVDSSTVQSGEVERIMGDETGIEAVMELDGQPAEKMLREQRKGVRCALGPFHAVLEAHRCLCALFRDLFLEEAIFPHRGKSEGRLNHVLKPSDPRSVSNEMREWRAAVVVSACEGYKVEYSREPEDAAKLWGYMRERAAACPLALCVLLWYVFTEAICMAEDTENDGELGNFDNYVLLLPLLQMLFVLTHATSYVPLLVWNAIRFATDSPAFKTIYRNFCFTKATQGGFRAWCDRFVENTMLALRRQVGKIFMKGKDRELDRAVWNLEKLEVGRGGRGKLGADQRRERDAQRDPRQVSLSTAFFGFKKALNRVGVFNNGIKGSITPHVKDKPQGKVCQHDEWVTMRGQPLNKDFVAMLSIARARLVPIHKAALEGKGEVDAWMTLLPAVGVEAANEKLMDHLLRFSTDERVIGDQKKLGGGSAKLFHEDFIVQQCKVLEGQLGGDEVGDDKDIKDFVREQRKLRQGSRADKAKALANLRRRWQSKEGNEPPPPPEEEALSTQERLAKVLEDPLLQWRAPAPMASGSD